MKLLVSDNIQTIKKVLDVEQCDVALSRESAIVRASQKKYDCVIVDGIDVSDIFGNCISVDEYLKSVDKSRKVQVRKQEVIAVWSVKGGTGKTTFVKELAESFPKEVSVLIIDLNFQDGGSDLSYLLELPVLPHIGMYLKEKVRTQETLLKNLCQYKSNIYVLQAPPKVSLLNNMEPQDIEEILKFARSKFEMIIFDLPNVLNEFVKTAMDNATKKVIISAGLVSEAKRISELEWKEVIVGMNSKGRQWKIYFKDFQCFDTNKPEELFKNNVPVGGEIKCIQLS